MPRRKPRLGLSVSTRLFACDVGGERVTAVFWRRARRFLTVITRLPRTPSLSDRRIIGPWQKQQLSLSGLTSLNHGAAACPDLIDARTLGLHRYETRISVRPPPAAQAAKGPEGKRNAQPPSGRHATHTPPGSRTPFPTVQRHCAIGIYDICMYACTLYLLGTEEGGKGRTSGRVGFPSCEPA